MNRAKRDPMRREHILVKLRAGYPPPEIARFEECAETTIVSYGHEAGILTKLGKWRTVVTEQKEPLERRGK